MNISEQSFLKALNITQVPSNPKDMIQEASENKVRTHAGTQEAFQTWRGTTLRGHLFVKRKGALSRNKKGTSLFIAKSCGARAPSAPPVPTSMNAC